MRVRQYISGKFHYVKYSRYIERLIDFKLIFSGKPGEEFCDAQINCWSFYSLLQLMVKLLPDSFFNFSLRFSYWFWVRSIKIQLKKEDDVDIYHCLCHGFTVNSIREIYPDATVLGHVVNAHPDVQVPLIKKSHDQVRIAYRTDAGRNFVDDRIVKEVEKCDFVLSPSKFVTDSYVANGFDPARFITLNYAVDKTLKVKSLRSDKVYGPNDVIQIVSVGQVIPRKGQFLICEAIKGLQAMGYQVELTIIGRAESEYLAAIMSSGVDCTHISHVKNSELMKLLPSYDLFVLASYEDGFAVAVTEAISCGLPVIVSSAVGALDLFEIKECSVFDVGSVESLCSKLASFGRGEYREEISDTGGWDVYANRLAAVYEKVVSS